MTANTARRPRAGDRDGPIAKASTTAPGPVLIMPWPSDDRARLDEQEQLLAELTELLLTREADLASSRTEFERFRVAYLCRFAPLYAELDRIEAQIDRLLATDDDHRTTRTRPSRAEARAETSEQAARIAGALGSSEEADASGPSRSADNDLRDLYRQAAKLVHPDTAATDDERARRTVAMAAVNQAYAQGDAEAIQRILDGEATRPEESANDDLATRLMRTKRMIGRIRTRLAYLDDVRRVMSHDPMWRLLEQCRERQLAGDDPLAGDEATLRARIASAGARLAALSISDQPTTTKANR